MDNKLHRLIDRSNLTPRERFLLLIRNNIEQYKTGKCLLTEADKASIENWHATNNEDAREWNTLNDGWRYSGRMWLEAEIHFHDAQAAHLQTRAIIMELIKYPLYREMRLMLKRIKHIKKVTPAEATTIAGKQRTIKLEEGLDYDYVVYSLAFERISIEDRKHLNELYPDIETDPAYLDQEETIAHLLKGEETLTNIAKDKLAKLIARCAYNSFAKKYQLFHYFACIPIAEVAQHFLAWKKVVVDGKPFGQNEQADNDDDLTHKNMQKAIEKYAKEHDISVEDILKQGFVHWYDEKGFEYTPLIVSDDKDLFLRWIAAKADAQTELQKLVSAGTLALRQRPRGESHKSRLYSKNLYDVEVASAQSTLEALGVRSEEMREINEKRSVENFSDRVITGESLYVWQADLEFVKTFKRRVDEYEPNLGLVYADDGAEYSSGHLDQELLICQLDEKGKPLLFSPFNLTMIRFENFLESVSFFEEERDAGTTRLIFRNSGIEGMFRQSREQFISGYSKLLALKEVTTKLSAIYETDLTFRLRDLFTPLDEYIETHNEALNAACRGVQRKHTGDDDAPLIAEVDPTLYIDKDSIELDLALNQEHTTKLKEILWNF